MLASRKRVTFYTSSQDNMCFCTCIPVLGYPSLVHGIANRVLWRTDQWTFFVVAVCNVGSYGLVANDMKMELVYVLVFLRNFPYTYLCRIFFCGFDLSRFWYKVRTEYSNLNPLFIREIQLVRSYFDSIKYLSLRYYIFILFINNYW